MDDVWVCVLVSPSLYRKGEKALEIEMGRIFGDDLREIRAVKDNDDVSEVEEYYSFVKCISYHDHIDSLVRSMVVRGVLDTYDNPTFLSESDVIQFVGDVEAETTPLTLTVGDIVEVKDGYLSGLTGIVSKVLGAGKFYVFFSFHIRNLYEEFHISSLTLIDNVFCHLKSPVSSTNLVQAGIQWVGATGIQFMGQGIIGC